MLDYFLPTLRVGLAHDSVTALRFAPCRESITLEYERSDAPPAYESMTHLSSVLDEMFGDIGRRTCPITIVLADHWLRYFSVKPPQNMRGMGDCNAAAAMRFQALFGEPVSGWLLHGDWSNRQPFVVAAVPTALHQMLCSQAAKHRLSLVSVVPQFIAAWNRHRRALADGQWFGTISHGVMTLGATKGHRLASVRTLHMPHGEIGEDWLINHLGREALRLNFPEPTGVTLHGAVPANWLHRQDEMVCKQVDIGGRSIDISGMSAGFRLAATGMK